ncbi:hypothetical protein I6A84_00715 [Frankia sp. CNm7]|uniref:Uncharacterized protein n=1 Tax=Frankia nepalensis TaxID=1836974 RepID=A0A937REC1_9ACTN|nr:hypothetical protein [Frankia nepalensis]MBL7496676.1 hypothetical protein [Frankia nepalensis]MBL7510682.1 hypothetical protein [Frankia nepalensis]MBL7516685.1 hypothetical protein [Frankia nepalensis]MBL7627415.1 hypothetical protein [Frankia nepalensis]
MTNDIAPATLAAAKCAWNPDTPERVTVTYLVPGHPADESRTRTAFLDFPEGALDAAGHHQASVRLDDGSELSVELDVKTRGTALVDLEANIGGEAVWRGMGLRDEDSPSTVLVSGWTGDAAPTGIVRYTIRDPYTIDAYYCSMMSAVSGQDEALPGRAIGDTRNGFPGTYAITYDGYGGTTWGPFEWTITARGAAFDLTWRQNGQLWMTGFGFTDPADPESIIVNYSGVQR